MTHVFCMIALLQVLYTLYDIDSSLPMLVLTFTAFQRYPCQINLYDSMFAASVTSLIL